MSEESKIPECWACDGSGWDWEAAEPCEYCEGTTEHPAYKAMRERSERAEQLLEDRRWISVEERLPEENGMYLVWDPSENVHDFAMYEGNWCYSFPPFDPILHDTSDEISHWMPLPAAPNTQDGEG